MYFSKNSWHKNLIFKLAQTFRVGTFGKPCGTIISFSSLRPQSLPLRGKLPLLRSGAKKKSTPTSVGSKECHKSQAYCPPFCLGHQFACDCEHYFLYFPRYVIYHNIGKVECLNSIEIFFSKRRKNKIITSDRKLLLSGHWKIFES